MLHCRLSLILVSVSVVSVPVFVVPFLCLLASTTGHYWWHFSFCWMKDEIFFIVGMLSYIQHWPLFTLSCIWNFPLLLLCRCIFIPNNEPTRKWQKGGKTKDVKNGLSMDFFLLKTDRLIFPSTIRKMRCCGCVVTMSMPIFVGL